MQSIIERYLKRKLSTAGHRAVEGVSQLKKSIHRRITPVVPSRQRKVSASSTEEKRSSIIDSGEENRPLMNERPMKETVFVLTSELLVCLLCFNEFSSHDIVSVY